MTTTIKTFFALLICTLASSAFAIDFDEYYKSLDGLKNDELRGAIYELITSKHNPIHYHDAQIALFGGLDEIDGSVCSIYNDHICFEVTGKKNKKFNIEHTWPKSKGAEEFPAKSDLHHLYLSDKENNTERGNLTYCENRNGKSCYVPPKEVRGDLARAQFYFSVRYGYPLIPKLNSLYKKWHREDPVSEQEKIRNDRVEAIQGNRNPFVDMPELIDLMESI